jgi:hypothetical protein
MKLRYTQTLSRDQGIGKAGNPKARTVMIELAASPAQQSFEYLVPRACRPVPSRAIGEGEAQLTVTRPSQSISPLLHATPASALLRRDPTSAWGQLVVVAPFRPTACADPCRPPSGPNTAPISVGFWASRSLARSPDRPGPHRDSLAFGSEHCLRLLPHTASRRQAERLATLSLRAVAFSLRLLPTRSAEDFAIDATSPTVSILQARGVGV